MVKGRIDTNKRTGDPVPGYRIAEMRIAKVRLGLRADRQGQLARPAQRGGIDGRLGLTLQPQMRNDLRRNEGEPESVLGFVLGNEIPFLSRESENGLDCRLALNKRERPLVGSR